MYSMYRFQYLFILLFLSKAGAQTPALKVADSLYTVGNYAEAISSLQSIIPATSVINVRLAKSYQARGKFEEAKFHYEKVLEEDPEKVLTLLDYASLLEKSGNLEKADSIFSSLVKRYPTNANFHYRLGRIKEERRDSTAIHHYLFAVSHDRSHQQALIKLAADALRNARLYASENYSRQGLKYFPGNPVFLSLLAQTYYHQKRFDLAAENFQLLLDQGEESEFIYSKLAASLAHLVRNEEAIKYYQKALEYKANEAQNHFSLGKLYTITEEYDKAEPHLLKSIILKTPILDAEYLSLGLTYAGKEDYKKALRYFSRALEENPDNERALFEKAIAADNYYEDLEMKINLYQNYLDRYSAKGNGSMVSFAESRKNDLREQLHLSKGN